MITRASPVRRSTDSSEKVTAGGCVSYVSCGSPQKLQTCTKECWASTEAVGLKHKGVYRVFLFNSSVVRVCWLKPYRPHRGVLTEALPTTQMCADWSLTDHTDVCWLKPYWPHRDLGQNFSILCFYQMLKKCNTQQLPLVFWHMCLTKISHIFFWDQTGLKCECLHWLCQYKW